MGRSFVARAYASVEEVGAIERVALHGAETGVADDAAQLLFGGAVAGSGGLYHIFFQHDRADIVPAEAQAHLADLQSLGDPACLHVGKVGEEDARDGERFEVFDGGGFRPATPAESSVLRLEGPGDEGGEASGFFLQVVDALEVVDAVLFGFANAEHHGGSGLHAKFVGDAVNVEPILGGALEAGDFGANFIVEDFSTAAGNRLQSGLHEAANGLLNRELAVLGDADDFAGGETVQMHLRKALSGCHGIATRTSRS